MTNEERAILLWRQLRFDACDRDPLRIIEAALDEAQREAREEMKKARDLWKIVDELRANFPSYGAGETLSLPATADVVKAIWYIEDALAAPTKKEEAE